MYPEQVQYPSLSLCVELQVHQGIRRSTENGPFVNQEQVQYPSLYLCSELQVNQGINQIRKHVVSKVSFGSVFR